jgi:hypothetical protein
MSASRPLIWAFTLKRFGDGASGKQDRLGGRSTGSWFGILWKISLNGSCLSRPAEGTRMNDNNLTSELAMRIMSWRTSPGRFLKPNKGWTPTWKFQPLTRLKDALELLEKATPQHYSIEGDEKTGFRVKVSVAGVTGEARGQSQPRVIVCAIARAIGIAVPVAVDGRKSHGI